MEAVCGGALLAVGRRRSDVVVLRLSPHTDQYAELSNEPPLAASLDSF